MVTLLISLNTSIIEDVLLMKKLVVRMSQVFTTNSLRIQTESLHDNFGKKSCASDRPRPGSDTRVEDLA